MLLVVFVASPLSEAVTRWTEKKPVAPFSLSLSLSFSFLRPKPHIIRTEHTRSYTFMHTHRSLRVLNNYYFESESIYVTAPHHSHEKREAQHRPLCNCGPDSASFPPAMLYHFLYTSLALSLLCAFSLSALSTPTRVKRIAHRPKVPIYIYIYILLHACELGH